MHCLAMLAIWRCFRVNACLAVIVRVQDMSRSKFCLAPTGGGHGKRQVGQLLEGQCAAAWGGRLAGA